MPFYPKLPDFMKLYAAFDNDDPKNRPVKTFYTALANTLRGNSRIRGHYQTRTAALTSFTWDLIGTNIPAIAKNRLSPPINNIIALHALTPLFGSSLYKLTINNTIDGSVIIPKRINNTRYDFDENNNLFLFDTNGSFLNQLNLSGQPLAPTAPFYILDTSPQFDKGGILASIMPIEIIRWDIVIENANYLRKLKGILQIVNKGASDEDASVAKLAASNAILNNYVITSDLIEFKLNEIASAGSNGFKDFLDAAKAEIAIAILGQANTSELPANGGSRAALQILQLISSDIFYSDLNRITNFINQILLIDYKLNVNPAASACPYSFAFNITEDQDVEKNALALQTIASIMPIKKSEAYAYIGFTPPEPNDDTLQIKSSIGF